MQSHATASCNLPPPDILLAPLGQRRLAVAWRQHAPAKSKITRLLEGEMALYEATLQAEAEAQRASMVGAGGGVAGSGAGREAGGGAGATAEGFEPEDLSAPSLSPWEVRAHLLSLPLSLSLALGDEDPSSLFSRPGR